HAGDAGQHEVQEDKLRPEGAHHLEAGFSIRGDFGGIAFHRKLVAVNVRHDLVVLNDQNFFHYGLKLMITGATSGWVLRNSWTRLYSSSASSRSLSPSGREPEAPSFSSARSLGTRCVIPSVALAPAQLWATRRTLSAFPSRMATAIWSNCLCVCFRNI